LRNLVERQVGRLRRLCSLGVGEGEGGGLEELVLVVFSWSLEFICLLSFRFGSEPSRDDVGLCQVN
jgi:hypothetical protein